MGVRNATRGRLNLTLLETIRDPTQLRSLSREELEALAGELRDKMIRTVHQTGGHLASSLGAVEIALALHRVMDSPRDRIVWDTGHQAYAHKLLTGRWDAAGASSHAARPRCPASRPSRRAGTPRRS